MTFKEIPGMQVYELTHNVSHGGAVTTRTIRGVLDGDLLTVTIERVSPAGD